MVLLFSKRMNIFQLFKCKFPKERKYCLDDYI